MEKEFVPYELAVKLKELGFDEPVFACFDAIEDFQDFTLVTRHYNFQNSLTRKNQISAPLWQQSFDWFREQFDLNGEVQTNLPLVTLHVDEEGNADTELQWQYNYRILLNKDGSKCDIWESKEINPFTHYETYEEARLACLEKLIMISSSLIK